MEGGGPATGLPRQLGAGAPMMAGTECSAGHISSLHNGVPSTCSVSSASLWYSCLSRCLSCYYISLLWVPLGQRDIAIDKQIHLTVLIEWSLLPGSPWWATCWPCLWKICISLDKIIFCSARYGALGLVHAKWVHYCWATPRPRQKH